MQIIGKPVSIMLGKNNDKEFMAHPTKLLHYEEFQRGLGVASLESYELHDLLKEANENNMLTEEIQAYHQAIIKEKLTLFESFLFSAQMAPNSVSSPIIDMMLLEVFNLFKLVFKSSDVLDSIVSNDQFEECKELIREINGVRYEKPSPNPEIRYWEEVRRKMEANKPNSVNFEAMYTSVMLETGMTPEEVNNLTIHQFTALFDRIQHMKSYEASILGAVVGGGDVHYWYQSSNEPKKPKTISGSVIYNQTKTKL